MRFDKKKLQNIEYILPLIMLALFLIGIVAITIATANPFTGEELTFTDMIGRVFRYTVRKICHADNARAETLADSESALTLFVKKNGAFLIVRCAAA